MKENDLTGEVPSEFAKITGLTKMFGFVLFFPNILAIYLQLSSDFQDNKLSGLVPSELGRLNFAKMFFFFFLFFFFLKFLRERFLHTNYFF